MRKSLLFFIFLSNMATFAQQKQFVSWSYDQKKTGADEFELHFRARIERGYHLYSLNEFADTIYKNDNSKIVAYIVEDGLDHIVYRKANHPELPGKKLARSQIARIAYTGGPKPTSFQFENSDAFELLGRPSEPKPKMEYEPMFGLTIASFETAVTFKQKIRALTDKPFVVKGMIDGMACNESQCQQFAPPPEFEFRISGAQPSGPASSTVATTQAGTETTGADTVESKEDSTEITSNTSSEDPGPRFEQRTEPQNDKTYFGLFIAGFLGGLLALLTPCVFPMIPMTVSFFIKQSKTKLTGIRNASIYALSIIVIYICLGLGVTLIFGADAVNNMATNIWFNLAFFLLLVVFAISFLGAFEITLPSSFVNRMDAKSDRGGLLGIFFMAFTLALVSFSCTGPIVGTLLVQAAATGALAGPFFGMLGFSMALALPFGLFAAFPGWLNSLPKSGGWLNSVKVVLGFLELALALKFLSNADLVVQAGIITKEVFLALWIVIFGLLGGYLMGWFKMPHDSEMRHLAVGRLLFAVIVFSFTVYLIPGLWGAPLKLISGFPPPDFYSESPEGVGRKNSGGTGAQASDLPEHAHRGPHGIPAFDDYYHALEHAKKTGKPLMLDFTGWACVNCRKMENQVWIDQDVKRKLSEDFILVSLYVDDKKKLPDSLQKEVNWHGSRRKLKSVGDRWSFLQNTKFDSSTQPQYWIIDANEKRYAEPTSYDPDIRKYVNWLDKGLEAFKKANPGASH